MEAAVDVFEDRLGKMDTTDLEANRENSEAIAVHQEVPNERAEVETVGPLEGRYGDRRLAVRRSGRLTRRAVSSLHESRGHKAPTAKNDDGRDRNAITPSVTNPHDGSYV
jgi:hypothetical protein